MGIQSWKRGVHTGNTIRAGGSSAQMRSLGLVKRQLNPPSAVIAPLLQEPKEEERKRVRRRGQRAKKVTQETRRSVEVEELDELEENVFYSLNKKGRWNLPEMIRTEIKYSKCIPRGQSEFRKRRTVAEDESRLDQDLTMIQCHSMKRGSNCFAVTSTKLPGDGTVSKSKNYLNVNSILEKKTRQRMRPNKKRKNATPQVKKAKEQPSTEIEISSPYPRNSYLQYADNARNSLPVSKDTRRSSRRSLSPEELCDTVKIDAYCDSKYCCFDASDLVTDECLGEESHCIDRKGKKSLTIAEPDDDSHVWFLEEFVQMPSSEFQDDLTEEEEEEEQREIIVEDNENLDNENVLNTVASDSSLVIQGVTEESDDWEILEIEVCPEDEELHEGDCGILAMLIEDALVRKATRLHITEEDTRMKKRKNKKGRKIEH